MIWLGKFLFRRSDPYEQRRKIRVLMVTLTVGLLVAGALAGGLFYLEVMQPKR